MTRSMRLVPLSLAFLLALPLACGGSSKPGPIDLFYPQDLPFQEAGDAPADEEGTRDLALEDKPPVTHRFEILLLHDTSQPENLPPGESLKVRAKVVDYAQGAPAVDMSVHFAIIAVANLAGDNADEFDGSFESDDASTIADGTVSDLFRAGVACDLKYTVELSLPDNDAEPKTLEIIVPCGKCGCAEVTLDYEGALPESALKDIDVYVLPTDYACQVLSAERPVPMDAVLADRTIANLFGTTTFDCLPSDTYYTFYAQGHRQGSPCVVTTGCNDGVFLQPDTCKDYKLKMYLATLNPTGQYDCIDHFDFTNMVKQCAGGDTTILTCATSVGDLGKTICCVLAEMIKFFETPGYTIIETIVDLAKQWLGSLIVDTVVGLFKDAVANILTTWLLNNSPPFIQDFFKIGGDMMGTITNLEMMSLLKLSKLNNDFSMQGDQYWHGLALYWKFGCDTSSPDYEECGRIPLDLDALNDPLFPKDLLGGKFTAILADFDKLIVNQHAIKLNYGKLVLYVLNEIIIKSITGGKAHTLLEVAHLWIDCKAISTGILGEIASWFGGSQTDIENVCSGTVDFLFGFVNSFINALSLDTELSVAGSAQLIDKNCDLKVDQITKGKNLGYVQGASSQASITGDFECTRK